MESRGLGIPSQFVLSESRNNMLDPLLIVSLNLCNLKSSVFACTREI